MYWHSYATLNSKTQLDVRPEQVDRLKARVSELEQYLESSKKASEENDHLRTQQMEEYQTPMSPKAFSRTSQADCIEKSNVLSVEDTPLEARKQQQHIATRSSPGNNGVQLQSDEGGHRCWTSKDGSLNVEAEPGVFVTLTNHRRYAGKTELKRVRFRYVTMKPVML